MTMLQEIKAFSIGATQDYDQFGTVKAEKESKRLNDVILMMSEMNR